MEFDEPVPGLFSVLRDGKSGKLPASAVVDRDARATRWEGGVVRGSGMGGEDDFATRVPPEVARNIIERHCTGEPAKP